MRFLLFLLPFTVFVTALMAQTPNNSNKVSDFFEIKVSKLLKVFSKNPNAQSESIKEWTGNSQIKESMYAKSQGIIEKPDANLILPLRQIEELSVNPAHLEMLKKLDSLAHQPENLAKELANVSLKKSNSKNKYSKSRKGRNKGKKNNKEEESEEEAELKSAKNKKNSKANKKTKKKSVKKDLEEEDSDLESLDELDELGSDDTLFSARFDSEGLETDYSSILKVRRSMLREDTTNLYDVDFETQVLISEELSIDCVWVTIANYYSIWDSEIINPYKYDINTWQDTLDIHLFDTTKQQTWSMPLASTSVTSEFGHRRRRWHHGVDLDLETGDPVMAAFDGIIRIKRYQRGGYGNFLVLRHYNGLETLYGHLSKQSVRIGEKVRAGQVIGLGGSTGRSSGPHLHYEVRYQGYAFNPEEIYDFENDTIKTSLFQLNPKHFSHLTQRRQTVYHIVEMGDTVYKLARIYNTSVRQLCRMNRMSTKTKLRAGRKIRIG
ncbi:MAG: LysM peptidoglycan-binding domain-containing protein [Bacteroidetes bacterium]|nr:MAG: LysM peptidoglycan-binding domain-containing protein [Bacteroidota bacterium]